MAVLIDSAPRKRSFRGLAALVALVAASCGLASMFGSGEERLGFSHRIHWDEGLECSDCHLGVDSEDEPGMPTMDGCMLCHEDIDSEKPPEQQISRLYGEDGQLAEGYTRLPGETIFSHLAHVNAEVGCNECHGDIETTDSVPESVALTMEDCMTCHDKRAVPNECTTCHSEYDKDAAPYTHYQNWDRLHGRVVRARSEERVDDCSMCHTEETCTSCHRDVQPQSHNNFFRLRGHASLASIDRQSCLTCHRADFCTRCHQETRPLSHTPAWGSPTNTHCLGCHTPLKSTNCYVCHKSTPSHQMAPPLPPDHLPTMNCRLCHGMGVPLPHPDNGTECILCHR